MSKSDLDKSSMPIPTIAGLISVIAIGILLMSCKRAAEPIDIYGKREYTSHDDAKYPIAYYRSYPRGVQRLLQRSDIENRHCRGGPGIDPETLRACNRGARLALEAERLGWCWDSIDHSGHADHWMRCADLPATDTQFTDENYVYFSAADIRELGVYTPVKAPCRDTWVVLPTTGSKDAIHFDIFGTPDFEDFVFRDFKRSEYTAYPASVRDLMRRHDMEAFGQSWIDPVKKLRSYNRRNHLLAQIEDRGWCWGYSDHISASDTWMKCSDIAGYTPDQPRADSALFSLEDMRKAVEEEKARCL